MFKFVNYFKNNVLIVSVIAIISVACVSAILVALNDTYAMDTHTIIFNRYEDTEIMDKCETDVNGKLDTDCITQISKICTKWSPQSQKDGTQTEQISSSDFANMIFDSDAEYYCVSGSSLTYNTGCYACNADETIMHWAASGAGNDSCPGGYTKIHENIEECKVYACYECNDNKNYMEWRYSAISDDNCPSGYNRTTKTQDECNVVIPDSCYVCKDDNNIFKWKNNGNADSSCSSGYNKTDIPENECVIIENPPTGDIAIFLVWILGLGCLVYSAYYFKNGKVNN